MGQPSLWDSTPEAEEPERDRWLAGIDAVAQWVIGTPRFGEQVQSAVVSGRQGAAFDRVLSRALCANPTGWTPRQVDGFGRVDVVRWGAAPSLHQRGGKPLADVILHIDDLPIPVNIKRSSGAARRDRACAERTAVFVALTGSVAPAEPITDLAQARMELRAGLRELVAGDYLILHVQTGGEITWSIQGLVGGVREDGRLASERHPSEARICFSKASRVVGPDDDIESMVADAWAPRVTSSDLIEDLYLVACDMFPTVSKRRRRTLAQQLLAADREELVRGLLHQVLNPPVRQP